MQALNTHSSGIVAKLMAMEKIMTPAKPSEQDFYVLLQMIRSKIQTEATRND
jgi:hypothetical protein